MFTTFEPSTLNITRTPFSWESNVPPELASTDIIINSLPAVFSTAINMEQPAASRPPLRLLSLDGGGIRGLSELYILEVIMHRVRLAKKLKKDPLPADYFDMICGTSTGGLIAILLGRLRLSVPQAIQKYGELSEYVFSEQKPGWKDGKFKASRLEEAIRDVLNSTLGPGREEERMRRQRGTACKTSVCAVPALNVSNNPRLFRSYICKDPSYNPTIWEAARATSAAPQFFKRIRIGDPGAEEEFIDGAVGYNNPAKLIIQEAISEYDPDIQVGCIVSIGTGTPRLAGFESPRSLFQKAIPTELIAVLVNMATSSESTSHDLEARYQNFPGLYNRLNVEQGLSAVALGEWKKLGEVKTHTLKYLQYPEVNAKIDLIVKSLLGQPECSYRLGSLGGSYREAPDADSLTGAELFIYPSFGVAHFVDRDEALSEIERCFEPTRIRTKSSSPRIMVLQGMGGCGKSQLALDYCKRAQHGRRFEKIFWIDVTSPETAMQSFTQIAESLGKPRFNTTESELNLQFVRSTLDATRRKWLLVFDNFDDPLAFPAKSIKQYFPSVGPGSILITSRVAEVRAMGNHSVDLNILSEAEAREILLRRARQEPTDDNLANASMVCKRLGYHALAIDQAGAYSLRRGMGFSAYLKRYNRSRTAILNESPDIWDYTKMSRESAEGAINCTVFAALELSLHALSGDDQAWKDKIYILTLMAFFDINKLTDSLFVSYGSAHETWMPSCQEKNRWDRGHFLDILSELRNLSLLQSLETSSDETYFSIHPLVQDWLKARIGKRKARTYVIEAMRIMSEYMKSQNPNHNFPGIDLQTKEFMFVHVEATILAKQEFYDSWDFLGGKDLLSAGARYYTLLDVQGRYKQAEELCRAVLRISTAELGEEHLSCMSDMHWLSHILRNQGNYAEAELLIRTRAKIKNYEEADKTSQELVTSSVKVLGSNHSTTMSAKLTRAKLLRELGDTSAATLLNREILEVSKRVFGSDAPVLRTSAASRKRVEVVKNQRDQRKSGQGRCIAESLSGAVND
ncbi:hypothetical protein VTL71DRAFT_6216 [Oculimacula yallundae]|uniref:PNPLA domain-containing protein n=1 Tax=Oculimacula yallundae TaxID=86028 RepID=A0ABR4BZR1_9HELO